MYIEGALSPREEHILLKRREGECKEKERRKKGIKRKEEGTLDAKGGKRK